MAKIQREHTGGGQLTHGFHLHLMFSTQVGYDHRIPINFRKFLNHLAYHTKPCFGCKSFHSDCFAGPSAHLAKIRSLTTHFEGDPNPSTVRHVLELDLSQAWFRTGLKLSCVCQIFDFHMIKIVSKRTWTMSWRRVLQPCRHQLLQEPAPSHI